MMNQEDIFKKIGLILDELQDQYEYLAQNPKQLNELELELFMANANFLSDHVQIVRKLNSTKVVKEIPEHTSTAPEPVEEKVVDLSVHQEEWSHQAKEIQEEIAEELNSNEIVAEETVPVEVAEEIGQHQIKEAFVESAIEREPIERDLFKLDKEPSTFEFILKDIGSTDQFEFEEKSVEEIFDRPLSKEEEEVIAQKQRIREQEAQVKIETETDDELGPEPFLVAKEEDIIPAASTQLVLDDFERKEVHVFKEEVIVEEAPVATYKAEESKIETPVAEVPVVEMSKTEAPKVENPKTEEPVRPTLNELLARQNGNNNVNTENSRNSITDLKQGINLNDKMLYIKDLFNGYNLAYAEVIDLLNKMPDFKTADSFLQNNYAIKNNWASRQGTVDKFYELLNQRFPANN
jgi:hypothetical protein